MVGSHGQSMALGVREGRARATSCPGIVTWGCERWWHMNRQCGQAPHVHARINAVASACIMATGTAVNGDDPAPGARPGMPAVVRTSTGRATWPENCSGPQGWQSGEERSGKGTKLSGCIPEFLSMWHQGPLAG